MRLFQDETSIPYLHQSRNKGLQGEMDFEEACLSIPSVQEKVIEKQN